ncbi:hypothetical protein W97_02222 [Coniosporium apollinis CBS 100218]|uniref:Mitochondrial carrier n=1 Tax=Coniosporium apollinis (strain CBS 100218) TaxID=1168221 RepID=R7YMX4_CONA1|nr:uncharacterized protein W97_02222 [Coniosporium apollinis CBS 100218]EON62996.1 hypothetical protein W97_02222 [Coniosporium apollinis CBS 100218]
MATSRDAHNPLRPYYIPPSIGLPPESAAANATGATTRPSSIPTAKPSFGTSARDILSDLDYGSGFLEEASRGYGLAEMTKRIVDQALWNYTSVLLAQPFEVAKTVLQCHLAPGADAPSGKSSRTSSQRPRRDAYGGEKYEDMPSYFTPAAPASKLASSYRRTSPHSPSGRRRPTSRSASSTPTPSSSSPSPSYKLDLRRSNSLLEVLSQLWSKEGAWGVWKGTNATFVYNVLFKTIESWTRSLLAALLNVSDPGLLAGNTSGFGAGGLDVIDSTSPLASLGCAVAAAGIAGCVLAPLDIVRTRLILTPTTSLPRAILPSLRSLPSYILPPSLLTPTLLHSTLPTLISASAPLVLRSTLAIDPLLTPSTYSLASFASSIVELFAKLPLETVLRRGQIQHLKQNAEREALTTLQAESRSRGRSARGSRQGSAAPSPPYPPAAAGEGVPTVVDVGPYRGVLGTAWYIAREEGTSHVGAVAAAAKGQSQRTKKGQGVSGLWRGWRVGFWGLVGVWGAAAMGGGAVGGEF